MSNTPLPDLGSDFQRNRWRSGPTGRIMHMNGWFLWLSLSLLVACGESAGSTSDGPGADDRTTEAGPGSRPPSPSAQARNCIRDAKCSSKEIISGLKDLRPITWSDGAAWAVSAGAITRIDDGGVTTLKTRAGAGLGVAVSGGVVFWDNAQNLNVLAPGKDSTVIVAADFLDAPTDLVAVGTRVYYRQDERVLWREPSKPLIIENGLSLPASSSSATGRKPMAMTVDSGRQIFWIDGGIFDSIEIKTIHVDVVSTLGAVADAHRAFALVATATHLVFADYDHRSVVAIPKEGGTPVTVADKQTDTYNIAADDSGVYWLSRNGLMRAETNGSGARRLLEIEFEASVGYLAVGTDAIYITDPAKGAILRVEK